MTLRKLLLFILLACSTTTVFGARSGRWEVTLKTTEGKIVLALYDETPLHRDNFISQVRCRLYDGVLFHRVIQNFMIQGGDPLSKNAEPGQLLGEGTDSPSEWISPEIRLPEIYHRRGVLAAAREGDDVNPEHKSSNQQFYIVTRETTPWLDGAYTVFGEVIKGMEVVDVIEKAETDKNNRPLQDIRVLKARITHKGSKRPIK